MTTSALSAGSDLLVDLDVAVRRGPGETRLHARHALCGTSVQTFVTADAGPVEVGRCDVSDWQALLARTCRVVVPEATPGPAHGLALPWDLLVATGTAIAQHRPVEYDVLVARAEGLVTVAGRTLTTVAVHEQLRWAHQSVVGRLRAVGTVARSRRIGWLSWVLFGDGWRSLTPYVEETAQGPRPMVRLEVRSPEDLVHGPARWALEATR
jgi:hypothetical protein